MLAAIFAFHVTLIVIYQFVWLFLLMSFEKRQTYEMPVWIEIMKSRVENFGSHCIRRDFFWHFFDTFQPTPGTYVAMETGVVSCRVYCEIFRYTSYIPSRPKVKIMWPLWYYMRLRLGRLNSGCSKEREVSKHCLPTHPNRVNIFIRLENHSLLRRTLTFSVDLQKQNHSCIPFDLAVAFYGQNHAAAPFSSPSTTPPPTPASWW